MTAIQWLLLTFSAVCAGMVAVFHKYYYRPPQDEPITPHLTPPMPIESPVSSPVAPKVSVETLCTYIRDYEGKPGDLNYLLANPLDCRPSPVGYLAKYQPVEIIDTDADLRYPYHVGKFAKFKDYATGWEYGVNMIHFMIVAHPSWNFYDLFNHFAPSSDKNDPNRYAESIAKSCGVVPTTILSTLIG